MSVYAWHDNGLFDREVYYDTADGKVVAEVRGTRKTFAWKGGSVIGEFVTTEQAKAAVEREFAPPVDRSGDTA